ncbi:hypothetical protein Sjap_023950 [Stephania japonica]|uniref:Uncharacterized protein n=1 Tax=Stephania japonica TaxID=461633 RepID=A0AAP0EJW7_9MAGN
MEEKEGAAEREKSDEHYPQSFEILQIENNQNSVTKLNMARNHVLRAHRPMNVGYIQIHLRAGQKRRRSVTISELAVHFCFDSVNNHNIVTKLNVARNRYFETIHVRNVGNQTKVIVARNRCVEAIIHVGNVGNRTHNVAINHYFEAKIHIGNVQNQTMGHMIQDINCEFDNIKNEMNDYNFIKGNLTPGPYNLGDDVDHRKETYSTSSLVDESSVVGREAEKSRLVALLTSPPASATSEEQERLSVLPIVGMGGLGKTTLA